MVVRVGLCSLTAWKLPLPPGPIDLSRQDPLPCRLDMEGGGEFHLDISAVAFFKRRSAPPFCIGLPAHHLDSNSQICLSASLPKPMGQVMKATRRGRKREAISFSLTPPSSDSGAVRSGK